MGTRESISESKHSSRASKKVRTLNLLLLALVSGCVANRSAAPDHITPQWYAENFRACIDPCGDAGYQRREELWAAVQHRPDLLEAVLFVVRDTSVEPLTRANAVLRLGRIEQERAFEFLTRYVHEEPWGSPFRTNAIHALGMSANQRKYAVLGRILNVGVRPPSRGAGASVIEPDARLIAAGVLGNLDTTQADSVLMNALQTSTDSTVRRAVRAGLARDTR